MRWPGRGLSGLVMKSTNCLVFCILGDKHRNTEFLHYSWDNRIRLYFLLRFFFYFDLVDFIIGPCPNLENTFFSTLEFFHKIRLRPNLNCPMGNVFKTIFPLN